MPQHVAALPLASWAQGSPCSFYSEQTVLRCAGEKEGVFPVGCRHPDHRLRAALPPPPPVLTCQAALGCRC